MSSQESFGGSYLLAIVAGLDVAAGVFSVLQHPENVYLIASLFGVAVILILIAIIGAIEGSKK